MKIWEFWELSSPKISARYREVLDKTGLTLEPLVTQTILLQMSWSAYFKIFVKMWAIAKQTSQVNHNAEYLNSSFSGDSTIPPQSKSLYAVNTIKIPDKKFETSVQGADSSQIWNNFNSTVSSSVVRNSSLGFISLTVFTEYQNWEKSTFQIGKSVSFRKWKLGLKQSIWLSLN